MNPVDQRLIADHSRPDGRAAGGREGDCLRCCIATITGLPYDEVPHLVEHGSTWFMDWRDWARHTLGVDVATIVPVDGSIVQFLPPGSYPAEVRVIACGPSPRRVPGNERARHAIVVDGNLNPIHDPHPSRAGLPSIDEVYVHVERYPRPPQNGTP